MNIMQFCQAFNAETQDKKGDIIPVEISVYEDKSFSFITKTPPAAHLIKKELNLKSGSAKPQADKGWSALPGAAHQDRRDQDAGPQCQRH